MGFVKPIGDGKAVPVVDFGKFNSGTVSIVILKEDGGKLKSHSFLCRQGTGFCAKVYPYFVTKVKVIACRWTGMIYLT